MTPRRVLLVLLGLGVFAGLRGIAALPEPPEPSPIFTEQVVVVGVTGRPQLTAGRPAGDLRPARTRYRPARSRSGRATWGTARRPAGPRWAPAAGPRSAGSVRRRSRTVRSSTGRSVRRPPRPTAVTPRLGTLADSVNGCVAAVGPGAALAAARPDGTLARYQTAEEFIAAGMATTCPITLVDAGTRSDEVIAALAADDSRTLIVTGVGPPPGSDDPALQVFYRIGTTFPGWATSASTRRTGIVTLTDLTRTLADFGAGQPTAAAPVIDGSPLAVDRATLTVDAIREHLAAVAALSDTIPGAYLVIGILAALLVAVGVFGAVRRDARLVRAAAIVGSALPGAMLLTGAVPWEYSDRPLLTLSVTVAVAWAILAAAAYGLGRLLAVPAGDRRLGADRGRVHRRRRARGTAAIGVAAQLPPDPRPALVRVRQLHLRRLRHHRAAAGRLSRSPAAGHGSTPGGGVRGCGDRLRNRDLRGLALHGQRLRRRHRPDSAGALAGPGAVRNPDHAAAAARGGRCGGARGGSDLGAGLGPRAGPAQPSGQLRPAHSRR